MNFKDLHAFETICRCGSISAASQELFESPQALSKMIQKMEAELDAPLLVRQSGGVVPTPCGSLLLAFADKVLQEYDLTRTSIRSLRLQNRGLLRMASAFGILRHLTPGFVHAFTDAHPDLHLDYMEYPDWYVSANLKNGNYDLALAPYLAKDPDLAYTDLFSCEIFFVTHPGSRFYDREEVSVREVQAEPFVLENENFLIHHIYFDTCRQEGVRPDIYFHTSGFSLCYKLCKSGEANTASMDFIFDDMKDETLRMIPFKEHPIWRVALLLRRDAAVSENLQALIDHAVHWCRNLETSPTAPPAPGPAPGNP